MEGWGEIVQINSSSLSVGRWVKVPAGFFSSGCFCRDLQVQVRHTHTSRAPGGPVQLTGWRWRWWWRVHGLPESRRWSFYSCCTRPEQVHSHTLQFLLKSFSSGRWTWLSSARGIVEVLVKILSVQTWLWMIWSSQMIDQWADYSITRASGGVSALQKMLLLFSSFV